MEFLDKLVLPQSLEHLKLLHYLTGLVLFIYVPYIGILTGGLWLSLRFKKKSYSENNPDYLKLAGEIIEFTTVNKSAGVILGLVPILGLMLTYVQILHTIQNSSIFYLLLAFIFFLPGIILTFVYRYSFSFSVLYADLKNSLVSAPEVDEAVKKYTVLGDKAFRMKNRAGKWALSFLLIGLFFLSAAVTLLTSSQAWTAPTGFLALFENVFVWFRWLLIVFLAPVLAGCYLLFIYFFWEGGVKFSSERYKALILDKLPRITLVFALIAPLMILINTARFPSQAYSNTVFLFLFLGILALFGIYHLLYSMLRSGKTAASLGLFLLSLFVTSSIVIAEEAALSAFSHKHAAVLGLNFDQSIAEMKKKVGAAGGVDAVAIFTAKCLACHAFDKKVVGPPYKQTLPKYEGNTAKLVEFIKNPYKINPEYPMMPNQGLKPQEATAIAKYIMEEYKKR